MKKTLQIFLVITAATFASDNCAFANLVNEQLAKRIALNFFKVNTHNVSSKTALTVDLKFTKTETDGTIDFYVFDINPSHGFVIVSADDNIVPVIGYSTEANFNNDFSKTAVADWMGHAAAHIYTALQAHTLADARITNLWTAYRSGNNPLSAKSAPVAPLLTTTWGQEPFYNQYAPFNNTDQQRCLAGCVATAMAQIMKYWNYPAQGTGSYSYSNSQPMYRHNYGNQAANFGATTYNWTNMPDSIDSANTDVATLMYQCGVSVAMDFGDDNQGGSGSYVLAADVASWQHSAQTSYATYFNYDGNSLQGVYQANYNSADWLTLIKNELNQSRPVQYQGEDPLRGGHTWVCDGYDNNDMLHMNWGWGGADNGYFSLSSLTAAGMNFSNNEEALIGIQPTVPVKVLLRTGPTEICAGDSTVLMTFGSGRTGYSWSPTTGLSCPTCAVTSAHPMATTVYTLTIDSNGFKGYRSVKVTVRTAVQIQNLIGTNVTCYGAANGSAVVNATGGTSVLNYLWSTGQSSSSVSNLSAGPYSLTVSDVSGCSASTFFSVSQPDSISISIETYQTVYTLVYGSVAANVTGGTGNFSYQWNNGEMSPALMNVSAGDYILTVTDNNGCTQTASTTITQKLTTTGINNISNGLSFNVYPNPASGSVTVQLENATNGATISLKNVLGQTLFTQAISDIQNKIDLSQVAEGSYMMEVKNGEKSFTKQIIVKK